MYYRHVTYLCFRAGPSQVSTKSYLLPWSRDAVVSTSRCAAGLHRWVVANGPTKYIGTRAVPTLAIHPFKAFLYGQHEDAVKKTAKMFLRWVNTSQTLSNVLPSKYPNNISRNTKLQTTPGRTSHRATPIPRLHDVPGHVGRRLHLCGDGGRAARLPRCARCHRSARQDLPRDGHAWLAHVAGPGHAASLPAGETEGPPSAPAVHSVPPAGGAALLGAAGHSSAARESKEAGCGGALRYLSQWSGCVVGYRLYVISLLFFCMSWYFRDWFNILMSAIICVARPYPSVCSCLSNDVSVLP